MPNHTSPLKGPSQRKNCALTLSGRGLERRDLWTLPVIDAEKSEDYNSKEAMARSRSVAVDIIRSQGRWDINVSEHSVAFKSCSAGQGSYRPLSKLPLTAIRRGHVGRLLCYAPGRLVLFLNRDLFLQLAFEDLTCRILGELTHHDVLFGHLEGRQFSL